MAPRPQNTQATAPATSSQSSTKALPGMKRGIAIGVAVSIATILIALLAYCAVQRRKKAKAKAKAKTLSSYTDSEAWPKDQKWPLESPVVEADAQTIHELEASPVPELATTHPAQELEGAQSPISELDSARSGPDSDTAAHGEKLLEWRSWNQALEGRNISQVDDQPHPPHPSSRREPPTLSISPPDNSTCPRLSLSPLGTSPMGLSPISVSPLEDAYFPNRRFSTSSNNR